MAGIADRGGGVLLGSQILGSQTETPVTLSVLLSQQTCDGDDQNEDWRYNSAG